MADKTWKVAERRLAALFGTVRRSLSGADYKRESGGCDDAHHPTLFLESKYRQSHPLWRLWDKCYSLAKRETKLPKRRPVIALFEGSRHGALLVMHETDVPLVAAQMLKAKGHTDLANKIQNLSQG